LRGSVLIARGQQRGEGYSETSDSEAKRKAVRMVDVSRPKPGCGLVADQVRIERTIKHGDTTYDIIVGPCKCGAQVVRVMRVCGASISVYEIDSEDYENVDVYVAQLHRSFAIDVVSKLRQLRQTIFKFNSRGQFDAHGMHPFRVRLIDKARLICSRFSKKGLIDQILKNPDNLENDVASAFILGCIATENHWLEVHKDAVFEGYAHIEGREAGRPLALAARLRQGRRTRKAVLSVAAKLYDQEPSLRRNDSETANRIAIMKLDSLRKRDGTFIGVDAIVKHLRAARVGR
jgi:hypothetical protein